MSTKYIILFVIAVISQHHCFSSNFIANDFSKNFHVTKKLKKLHSRILYVTHKGTQYIIKQKTDSEKNIWCIIQVILADVFAHSTDVILSQKAKIIPGNTDYPEKFYKQFPALLLTIVPGKSMFCWKRTPSHLVGKKTKSLLKHFSARQGDGINDMVLKSMERHKDLSSIAALFTVIGYGDGHRNNIFYDQDRDRFAIIDMDASFNKNLALGSYLFIKKYHDENIITENTRRALQIFADTLETLMEKNPIQDIVRLTVDICNVLTNDSTDTQKFKKYIEQVNLFLEKSYAWSKKLIYFIRHEKDLDKNYRAQLNVQ